MKLPYANANFASLRTEGYVYVDKTLYLRSRRFGKTLFCNMLGWYYDRNHADRFEDLFSGTYIGAHPTPRRSSYMILSFNFSGINTETLENAHEGFAKEVRSSVRVLIGQYQDVFAPADRQRILSHEKPNDLLNDLFQTMKADQPKDLCHH